MTPSKTLKVGDVVQLSPEVGNSVFAGCFMLVTELKVFGAQGFVAVPEAGGVKRAYYRAKWAEMELVGPATWVAEDFPE